MALSVLRGLAGSFIGVTLGYIVCGLWTSGDEFASGMRALMLAVVLAALVGGAYLGIRARSKPTQIALTIAVLGCLLFWLTAPRGWWALPPPTPGEVQVR